jgi:hypothetical protein
MKSDALEQFDSRMTVDIRQSEIAPGISPRQSCMVKSECIKQRGMQVMHMHRVIDWLEAEVISGPISQATANSTTSHPDTERCGMMISTIGIFHGRCTSEFRTPDDEGFIEQAALLEILQQGGNWSVDSSAFAS